MLINSDTLPLNGLKKLLIKFFISLQSSKKIEKCINNCVPCILINRKCGKQEGLLNPIEKVDLPLHSYHIDHLGPLENTHKRYKHIFSVIDTFTKFIWLYPTKTTNTAEVLTKLDHKKSIFGNPTRVISDRGTAHI